MSKKQKKYIIQFKTSDDEMYYVQNRWGTGESTLFTLDRGDAFAHISIFDAWITFRWLNGFVFDYFIKDEKLQGISIVEK